MASRPNYTSTSNSALFVILMDPAENPEILRNPSGCLTLRHFVQNWETVSWKGIIQEFKAVFGALKQEIPGPRKTRIQRYPSGRTQEVLPLVDNRLFWWKTLEQ